MGSKPSSTTTSSGGQSSTNTPPAWLNPYYQNIVGRAQGVANTPYQAYTGQLVAPINAQQKQGIGTINQAAGSQDPYNAAAFGLAGASAGQINPSAIDAAAIAKYESPYQSQVINATEAELQNANQQQAASLTSNAAASGALGSDRSGVAQAQLAGQQDIANNATIANLYNQNYAQALGEANTQQAVGLAARQNTAARELAASGQFGVLGQNAVSEGLAAGEAQANAGTLEQQTSQARDTAAYNQYMQRLAYPFQTTGWLANIAEGIGSQSGGTNYGYNTGQQQNYNNSALGTLGGGLLGFGSLLRRGGRVGMADGGGLGGAVLTNAPTVPWYNDPAMIGSSTSPVTGAPQGPGGGSSVPALNLPIGHTMPSPQQGMRPSAGTAGAASNGLGSTGNLLKSLGGAFGKSSFGDTLSDTIQDIPDSLGLARGGLAGARHFDTGGDVNPLTDVATRVMANNLFASAANGNLTAQESGIPPPPQGLGTGTPVVNLPPQLQPSAPEQPGTYPPSEQPPSTMQLASAQGLGAAAPSQSDPMRQFQHAIASVESAGSGGYSAIGPETKTGDHAFGKYQIMGANIPQWTAEVVGRPLTTDQFLANPQVQDAVFNAKFGSYLKATGSPQDAASMWFTGRPLAEGGASRDANGLSGVAYVNRFQHALNGDAPPALAFDGTGAAESGAPGQQAITAAMRGLGVGPGATPSDESFGWLDRTLGGTGQHSKGLLGLDLPDSVRAMMLQTAAGMMGARTQNPGQALGEGLMTGIQGTRAMGLQNVNMALRGAQAVSALTDAQIKQMNLKMMFDAFNQMQTEGKKVGTAAEAGASGAPVTTMIPPTGNAVPSAGVNYGKSPQNGQNTQQSQVAPGGQNPMVQSAPAPPQIPNSNNPAWLHAQANNFRLFRPEYAAQLDARAKQIESNGITYDVSGAPVQIPGIAALNQQVEAQQTGARAGAEAQFQPMEAIDPTTGAKYPVSRATALGINGAVPQTSGQNGAPAPRVFTGLPLGAEENMKMLQAQDTAAGTAIPNINTQLQRFNRIAKIMETYQPGAFAQEKAGVIAALSSVGINVPPSATMNASAFQEFLKDTMANTFAAVKDVGGGRVLVSEIQGLQKSTAAPNMQPSANAQIIAQATGALTQRRDYNNDYLNWHAAHPMASTTDAAKFENDWYGNHALEDYISASRKNIAYSGQVVPSAKNGVQPVTGQAYNYNGIIYRWNGKQLMPERRAGAE